MKMLMSCRWAGNVRELENTIERLMILAPGDTIDLEHVPESVKNLQPCSELVPSDIPDEGLNLESLLENAEKALLQKAMDKAGGVKTEAAKLLGLSFRSFRHRLQKYGSS
jgi:two-component system response regulator PilR (NtrC family)